MDSCSRKAYPSDLTDEQWALLEPILLASENRLRPGPERVVDLREVTNTLLYLNRTGCQWAFLPHDLLPNSTVYDYFDRWSWDGTLERIHHALYVKCREQAAREASPTAAIIDAQSVKATKRAVPASIRMAMMPARRSKARSGTSWSIPRASC